MHLDTLFNHHRMPALAEDNSPLVSPIYQSTKFTFKNFEQLKELFGGRREGYFYSRYKNPTVHQLETVLAKAQGCETGLACASGVSAIAITLLALLKSGDQVVYFIESYRPTRSLIEETLSKFGVEGVKLSIDDQEAINKAFQSPRCKMVIWESPTNPQLKIPDNKSLVSAAKDNEVLTVMDNTFGGFHKHGHLEADIYLHSLTKYACGHSDVMGGVILTRQELMDRIFPEAVNYGSVLDPHAAYLILRGLKTYQLRYDREAASAAQLAERLMKHPAVEQVFYPGIQHKGEDSDYGSVLMFNLKDKTRDIGPIIDGLKLFSLSASLGSTESLVAPALFFYGLDLNEEQRRTAQLDETSLRLSIGLESVEELWQDLNQALA